MENLESRGGYTRRLLPLVAFAMLLGGNGCKNEYDMNELPGTIDPNLTECSDGRDNDGDERIDDFDPHCEDAWDETEGEQSLWEQHGDAQCSDGIDNDGDGYIDLYDQGCYDYVLTGSGEYDYMYLPWDDSEYLDGYQPVE